MSSNLLQRLISLIRTENRDRLFWWREPSGRPGNTHDNFGDVVGPYLYEKITGRPPQFGNPSDWAIQTVYLSVGSIIRQSRSNCIVWGSGIIERDENIAKPQSVLAVRGPQTRARLQTLGIKCPAVFGDPAILLPLFFDPDVQQEFVLGIIPHFVDYEYACSLYSDKPGVLVIDLLQPVEAVIKQIKSCKSLVSSSLHGVIVSQSYGVPSAWIRFSDKLFGDDIKFQDYLESVEAGASLNPLSIDPQTSVDDLIQHARRWPQPTPAKIKALQDGLLSSCPFR